VREDGPRARAGVGAVLLAVGRVAYLVKVTYFQAVWVVEFTLSPDRLLT
jgi:hypothetical protein